MRPYLLQSPTAEGTLKRIPFYAMRYIGYVVLAHYQHSIGDVAHIMLEVFTSQVISWYTFYAGSTAEPDK